MTRGGLIIGNMVLWDGHPCPSCNIHTLDEQAGMPVLQDVIERYVNVCICVLIKDLMRSPEQKLGNGKKPLVTFDR